MKTNRLLLSPPLSVPLGLLIFSLLLIGLSAAYSPQPVMIAQAAGGGLQPVVIAHRGGPVAMPENTIEAFQNAIRLGVDVLEFDLNLTSDDEIVIHHDVKVNSAICSPVAGSSVQPGPIRLMSLDEIRQFDCGSKRSAAYPQQISVPGARMPTLEEFFRAVSDKKVMLFGETKMPAENAGSSVDPVRFIELVEALVRKYKVEDRFILQSADYRTIDAMYRKNPRIRRCLLGARRFKPDYLGIARRYHATHLVLSIEDLNTEGVKLLQGEGLTIFSNVADRESDWREYLRMGMDGILSNDPQGLIAFLKSAGARQ